MPPVDIHAEFGVAATEVHDEHVPGTDHPQANRRPAGGHLDRD